MSVLIKGMEMPNNCAECQLNHDTECAIKNCMVTDDCYVRRASWCPINHVPLHGRLIDADALLSLLDKCMFPSDMVTTSAVRMATNWIKDAPTIIPAEEE